MKINFTNPLMKFGNSEGFVFPTKLKDYLFNVALQEAKGITYTFDSETKTITAKIITNVEQLDELLQRQKIED